MEDTLKLMYKSTNQEVLNLSLEDIAKMYSITKDEIYYAGAFVKLEKIIWKLYQKYSTLDNDVKVEKAMFALYQCLNTYSNEWKGNEARDTKSGGLFSTHFYAMYNFRLYDEIDQKYYKNKLNAITFSLDKIQEDCGDKEEYQSLMKDRKYINNILIENDEIVSALEETDTVLKDLAKIFNLTTSEQEIVEHIVKNKINTKEPLYVYKTTEVKNDCPQTTLEIKKRTREEILEEQLGKFPNYKELLKSITRKMSAKKLEEIKKENLAKMASKFEVKCR